MLRTPPFRGEGGSPRSSGLHLTASRTASGYVECHPPLRCLAPPPGNSRNNLPPGRKTMPLHASHAAELAEFLSAVRRTFELTAADRSKQHPTSPEPALTSTTPASASNEPAQTLRFEFAGSGSFNQPDFEGSLSCSAFTRAGRACAAPPRMGQPFASSTIPSTPKRNAATPLPQAAHQARPAARRLTQSLP